MGRHLLKWLMIIVGIAGAILALFVLWYLLTLYWAPIVFSLFIIFCMGAGIASLFFMFRRSQDSPRDSILVGVFRAQQSNWRNKISFIMEMVSLSTGGWIVATIFWFSRRHTGFSANAADAGLV